MALSEAMDVLNAAHLADLEDNLLAAADQAEGDYVQPNMPVPGSLMDAVERLRRIAYHRGRIASIEQAATEMIAPLQAQIDQIRAWAVDQKKGPEQRIWMHEQSLIAFYKTSPPTGSKTLKLPGGAISARAQQPEWDWQDEDALIELLDNNGHPAIKRVPKLDKAKLKGMVQVRDDGAVLEPETGEVLPGVVVRERPDAYTVKVDPA